MHSLFITAITFHVVSVFAEAGRGAGEAFGLFLPVAIVATSVNLCAAWLADSNRLQPFLLAMLLGFMTATMVLASAIGPALFSLGLDWSGSYATAQWLCISLMLPLVAAALLVPQTK